ncbi:MAG: aminotransferase class V-fold PLP-dependent enzyme [Oligoflexia bacterium]|nr:aminotransferase class V-fold PLP-dependent enzyme [Oligoflexia bacterium]
MPRTYLTPGPSQLHPQLSDFIGDALRDGVPSWSHRSAKFDKIYESAARNVKQLLGIPDKFHCFFVASGTEAMERTVQNLAAKHSFHFVNGAFSERFYQNAREIGKNARLVEAELGEAFNLDEIQIPAEVELVCTTHNETSTGVMLPNSFFSTLKMKAPKAFLAVDVVSSAPYPKLDYSIVDCVFFSVQKCFGMPAGLGVLLVSDAAVARSLEIMASGVSVGCFHNFPTLLAYEKKFETPETPNVLGIYLLMRVTEDYLARGAETLRKETDQKAKIIYETLSASYRLGAFVEEERFRSKTVVCVDVRGDLKKLRAMLDSYDIEVGSGYGKLKDSQIRIANFPTHSTATIEKVCDLLRKWQGE